MGERLYEYLRNELNKYYLQVCTDGSTEDGTTHDLVKRFADIQMERKESAKFAETLNWMQMRAYMEVLTNSINYNLYTKSQLRRGSDRQCKIRTMPQADPDFDTSIQELRDPIILRPYDVDPDYRCLTQQKNLPMAQSTPFTVPQEIPAANRIFTIPHESPIQVSEPKGDNVTALKEDFLEDLNLVSNREDFEDIIRGARHVHAPKQDCVALVVDIKAISSNSLKRIPVSLPVEMPILAKNDDFDSFLFLPNFPRGSNNITLAARIAAYSGATENQERRNDRQAREDSSIDVPRAGPRHLSGSAVKTPQLGVQKKSLDSDSRMPTHPSLNISSILQKEIIKTPLAPSAFPRHSTNFQDKLTSIPQEASYIELGSQRIDNTQPDDQIRNVDRGEIQTETIEDNLPAFPDEILAENIPQVPPAIVNEPSDVANAGIESTPVTRNLDSVKPRRRQTPEDLPQLGRNWHPILRLLEPRNYEGTQAPTRRRRRPRRPRVVRQPPPVRTAQDPIISLADEVTLPHPVDVTSPPFVADPQHIRFSDLPIPEISEISIPNMPEMRESLPPAKLPYLIKESLVDIPEAGDIAGNGGRELLDPLEAHSQLSFLIKRKVEVSRTTISKVSEILDKDSFDAEQFKLFYGQWKAALKENGTISHFYENEINENIGRIFKALLVHGKISTSEIFNFDVKSCFEMAPLLNVNETRGLFKCITMSSHNNLGESIEMMENTEIATYDDLDGINESSIGI